ncbi:serine hydrolase domain-containing protein [Spirosoma validum]|uniref:Serine hydrolase n=1 Tax=Spirosoma validum TaxID=2771355 RepID=A0A927B7Q7_9BACT|nr:serine hydrolase [Spirosoma validum]MBD2756737.1 serine hydrolase [Spirosoma validum]
MKNLLLSSLLLISYLTAFAQNQTRSNRQLFTIQEAEKQVVLLNNQSGFIPIKELSKLKIASVHVAYDHQAAFDSIASTYNTVTNFTLSNPQIDSTVFALHDKLKLYNLILITLSDSSPYTKKLLNFIRDQQAISNVVIVLAGSGKNLAFLESLNSPIIWYKTNTAEGASVAAQLIFGGVAATGRLDAAYGKMFKQGSGYTTQKTRLGYSVPEAVSVHSDRLAAVDSLVRAGIAAHITPGAVVLMAKDGQVVFHKAYGKHTYSGTDVTRLSDIYDLASVTKVSATTPSVMRLYDQKRIDLNDSISKYVARTRLIADKADLKIKEALLHEAGYTPYIKFYEQLKPSDMGVDSSAAYPTKVADHYFLRANYFEDVMWPVTLRSKGGTRGKYVYSDVSMYMMKEVIETVSHQKLNDYVLNEFYRPLGMQSAGFLPRNRFPKSRIAPTTENDNWFRSMLVQGYVNDPGAAMAGGVEGHAGLFANANDLAILYQMYLNKGSYGGVKYIEPTTIDLFTAKQSEGSGRGYGFDRTKLPGQATKTYASDQAYGHSGYTGTYVWVDPKYNLVYICLTNRVYPDDGKTYGKPTMNLRAELLNIFYEAVATGK